MARLLFCRPIPPPHDKFADAVYQLARSPKEQLRAIGLNLIYDHRVSESRANHFVSFVLKQAGSAKPTEQSILNGLRDYRREFVAKSPELSFDEGRDKSLNYIEQTTDLVHVCNVTSKLIRISNYTFGNPEIGNALTRLRLGKRGLNSPIAVDEELRPKFASDNGRSSFVDGFLDLLNVYSKIVPWNPIWLADWPAFDLTVGETVPSSWTESVGLPCAPAVEWVMVVRYPASAMKRLYRPTQLEAGDFPYHFPSPPCAECKVGGHPMNMGNPASGRLLSEFIHTEIPFANRNWKEAGLRLGSTPLNRKYDVLMTYRRRHYELLTDSYGFEPVHSWMHDPTQL
jgi:hypothetical protein